MRKVILLLSLLVSSIVVPSIAWAGATPAVVTGSASSISDTGAQLHASVNPEGISTSYFFAYGPTAAFGSVTALAQAGHGSKAVPVTAALPTLTPGSVYYYRIEAGNKFGAAFGAIRTFTTAGHPPPGAVTGGAVNVGRSTVTLTGTVVSQGENTSAYFEYGTTTAYGVQTSPSVTVTASTAPTAVSSSLGALSPGTTFHYRLVADHSGSAPEYGLDQTFTTLPLVRYRSKVTAHTTPVHARHKPYLFTTTGKVIPRAALPLGVDCSGVVDVRFSVGRRAVGFRKVYLQPNCAFSAQILYRHLIHHRAARLGVEVSFRGNAYLRSGRARTQKVRLG